MPENCGYRHGINAILMVQIEINYLKKKLIRLLSINDDINA